MKTEREVFKEEIDDAVRMGDEALEKMKVTVQISPLRALLVFPAWCLLVPILALLKWLRRTAR